MKNIKKVLSKLWFCIIILPCAYIHLWGTDPKTAAMLTLVLMLVGYVINIFLNGNITISVNM